MMKIDKILETIAFISGVEKLYLIVERTDNRSIEIVCIGTEFINAITHDGKIKLGVGSEYSIKNFVRTREEAESIAVEKIKKMLDEKEAGK